MADVEAVYAYLAEDVTGDEGVPAYIHPVLGLPMPMMGTSRERVEALLPHAKMAAAMRQKAVKLVKFTNRVTVRTIKPGPVPKLPPEPDKPPPEPDAANPIPTPSVSVPYSTYDEPQLADAADIVPTHGIVVAAALGDEGPSFVLFFRTDEGWTQGLRVSGQQRMDMVKLVNDADKTIQGLNN